MRAFYNENDLKTAAWLKELVAQRHCSLGKIDTRSIEDINPLDLAPYERCHFFSGIGGWEYALKLAGWPRNRPVWTGSCPCQPFSSAGQGKGFADERHLWPAWFWLIEQCRPDVIFGEQVAGKHGLAWFDLVSSDLEAIGYTVGAVVVGACSVGAPHLRKRLYWVAHTEDNGWKQGFEDSGRGDEGEGAERFFSARLTDGLKTVRLLDGTERPIEPSIYPLANGVPARVVRLRGYGNAIVPQVASEFIKAFMRTIQI